MQARISRVVPFRFLVPLRNWGTKRTQTCEHPGGCPGPWVGEGPSARCAQRTQPSVLQGGECRETVWGLSCTIATHSTIQEASTVTNVPRKGTPTEKRSEREQTKCEVRSGGAREAYSEPKRAAERKRRGTAERSNGAAKRRGGGGAKPSKRTGRTAARKRSEEAHTTPTEATANGTEHGDGEGEAERTAEQRSGANVRSGSEASPSGAERSKRGTASEAQRSAAESGAKARAHEPSEARATGAEADGDQRSERDTQGNGSEAKGGAECRRREAKRTETSGAKSEANPTERSRGEAKGGEPKETKESKRK